jgi:AraC-like DNA-binding protein
VGEVSVTRAAHAIQLINFFERLGTPVERELARVGLPAAIEDFPEAGVSMRLVERFRKNCTNMEKVENLGWLLHHGCSIDDLNPHFTSRLRGCATLFEALNLKVRLDSFENNFVRSRVIIDRESCRYVYNAPWGFKTGVDESESEWHRLMAAIFVVRCFTGPTWQPERITFMSTFNVPNSAREAFAKTQFRVGQSSTSISFPAKLLTSSHPPKPTNQIDEIVPESPRHPDWGAPESPEAFIPALRSILKPYLCEFRPSIALAAEIIDTSPRSLQRKLKQYGMSYSRLLDQCRFELASHLLANSKGKIIDISLTVGFEDPSHFARAFRRFSGLSPREYRATVTGLSVRGRSHPTDDVVTLNNGGQDWQAEHHSIGP